MPNNNSSSNNNQRDSNFPLIHQPCSLEDDEPRVPEADASAEEWAEFQGKLAAYVDEWCEVQTKNSSVPAHVLWSDFTCDFSKEGLNQLNGDQATRIRSILMSRGVQVKVQRGLQRKTALIECWEMDNYNNQNEESESNANSTMEAAIDAATIAVTAAEEAKKLTATLSKQNKDQTVQPNASTSSNSTETDQRPVKSSGIQGLIKAFQSRKKYNGQWDEDLNECIEFYELASEMCNLTAQEKLKGLPTMLEGNALSYYATNVKGKATTFEEATDMLTSWFTSDEQKSRLLQEWHSTTLSSWFRNNPEKSQLSVFKEMSARLSRVQRQLDARYREDVFLRDQLISATDLSDLKKVLRVSLPKTAHDANQKIASLLSSESGSAGEMNSEDFTNFSLGQRLNGLAERKISRNYRGRSSRSQRKKMSSKIRGCWVCGGNHLARRFHPKHEVDEALQKLRGEKAFVTAEDVVNNYLTIEDSSSSENSDEEPEEVDASDENFYVAEMNKENRDLEVYFANSAFAHTFFERNDINDAKISTALVSNDVESASMFNGITIDTGANRRSIMSLNQYKAYCKTYNVPTNIFGSSSCVYGLGSKHCSVGSTLLAIPFPSFNLVCDIEFYIMDDNIRTLLSLRDLKDTGIDISVQEECLKYRGKTEKLNLENDFLVYRWITNEALYTTAEIRKLHRSFGHPSIGALSKLLRIARPEEFTTDTKSVIEDITRRCKICVENSSKPKRFKLAVGSENARFNHSVAVDIMYLHQGTTQKPVLHVVDEATHFSAGRFLRRVSSSEVWKAFVRCWNNVYMGPPDYLNVDQGTQFISEEFNSSAHAAGITVCPKPVESPASMTHVERYHAPLRAAYNKLRQDLPHENADALLQISLHCVNSTVGPEGLCPIMCVFGTIPRPARKTPTAEQWQRAKAIDMAMEEVMKEQAKRKITFGLKYRGPYGKEQQHLDKLTYGSPVRVYRNTTKKWEGPYKFIFKEGETVCVQLSRGRKIFRSHSVMPDTSISSQTNCACDETSKALPSSAILTIFGDDNFQELLLSEDTTKHDFKISRKNELQGLHKNGVFEIIKRSTIPKGTRVYGTRFVDAVKETESGETILKSRLIAQNYNDQQSRHIPTKSPTVSKASQRLALCIAAMQPMNDSYVRDITQAYTQSKSKLERPVFLEPVEEMKLDEGYILKAVKPLYGIPESGLHWFITYTEHHMKNMNMRQTTSDPCLLFKRTKNNTQYSIPNLTILQVDDSFGVGDESFLKEEDRNSAKFKTKPRKLIKPGTKIIFNGAEIERKTSSCYKITQKEKLSTLSTSSTTKEAKSIRAKLQYISTTCRPDIASCAQLLTAKICKGDQESITTLNKLVAYCKETYTTGLSYVKLDPNSLSLVLYTDASFANADGLTSQTGFVILLADESGAANIIHYASKKCRRVARSVMAAELLALINGFDEGYFLRHCVEELLNHDIPLEIYLDSRTTFNCLVKNKSSLEKRLRIDVAGIQESIQRKEISKIGWISGKENCADSLTKQAIPKKNSPLITVMETNKLQAKPSGWTEILV